MPKPKGGRGTVRTELPDPAAFVDREFVGRFSVPRRLRAVAELPHGVHAAVEIEVADGRARATSVIVRGGGRHGVGWTALAKVPVRDIVATALLMNMFRTTVLSEKEVRLEPIGDTDPREVFEAIQRLVGYRPKLLPVAEGER